MSNPAFYGEVGEDSRPLLCEVLLTLYRLTGSMDCAVELVTSANEIEAANPDLVLTAMPPWIN